MIYHSANSITKHSVWHLVDVYYIVTNWLKYNLYCLLGIC